MFSSVTCRWLIGAVAAATAAFAGASAAQDAAAPDKGEQIMNASCTTCHDLRPIQTQALDADAWRREVASMRDRGADVADADVPVLVEYLAKTYGPLPEGEGKKILLNTCTVCHDLTRVKRTAATAEEWADTLSAMLNEGAMLSDEEFPILLKYLARNFRAP